MSGIEIIKHNGKVYAMVIRKNLKIDGTKFLTSQDSPFQIGVHLKNKGSVIEPHIHKKSIRVIKETLEFLHVDYGKLEAVIYDEKKRRIKTVILKGGDSLLAVRGGHGFKALGKTKITEVKQGPYVDVKADKTYL
jgi:hypothetical protein